jgi:DMSO/TMAO reductase YedYZ molybdopterin-dependent catalytic subunit
MTSEDPKKRVDRLKRVDRRPDTNLGGRIPPGQFVTEKFPVLHYGDVPETDLESWDFRIFGLVGKPMRLGWKEFRALPETTLRTDIHCVTRWSKLDTVWSGVLWRDFVNVLGISFNPEVSHVMAHCEHGFTTNLPLDVLYDDESLFAWSYDGYPLTPDHGWPLRLLVPKRYFWKSAKWIRGVEFMASDRPGFWERNGYHMNGEFWNEERFSW